MYYSDFSAPLAAFITFRTYGTWLHGDERGSVDLEHNIFGTPRIAPNTSRQDYEAQLLKCPAVKLESDQRECTRIAVREACNIRNWPLFALNVRTNHVHIVAATDTSAKKAMAAFKAYATTEMRRRGVWMERHGPWARGGSARLIWTQSQLERATYYVMHRQGADLD